MSSLLVVFGRAARARSRPSITAFARWFSVLVFAVVVTIGLFGDSAAHAAGGGYGPGIAGPAGAPGGFSNVVTSQAFDTAGGTVTAAVPGGQAQLSIPAGAFGQPVQAVITAPDLSSINAALPHLGFGAYMAIGGVGISIDDASGKPLTALFVHPLTLTITGAGIGAGDLMVEFTSLSTAATLQAAVFGTGSVTVTLAADPDFAVLAPTPPASSSPAASAAAVASPSPASSSAPTAVEGEHFTKSSGGGGVGRTVLVVLVVVAAAIAAMVLAARRRRPNSFVPRHAAAGPPTTQRRTPSATFAPKHARS